jgi:hypothetical protein
MRRFTILVVVGALLALSLAMVSQSSAKQGHHGLTSSQLANHGWTCLDVGPLGVHCAPPGKEFPPTATTTGPIQLLYFNVAGDQFQGTETMIRKTAYHGQPCPTDPLEPGDEWVDLGFLGLPDWLGCHRN